MVPATEIMQALFIEKNAKVKGGVLISEREGTKSAI
jgi:hypothetical protein